MVANESKVEFVTKGKRAMNVKDSDKDITVERKYFLF